MPGWKAARPFERGKAGLQRRRKRVELGLQERGAACVQLGQPGGERGAFSKTCGLMGCAGTRQAAEYRQGHADRLHLRKERIDRAVIARIGLEGAERGEHRVIPWPHPVNIAIKVRTGAFSWRE